MQNLDKLLRLMPSDPEERRLIADIAANSREAAERFDRLQREYLTSLCRTKGIPLAEIPDLVQDVLIAAIRSIQSGRFRGDSSLRTFLLGILRNKIADFWRRRSAGISTIGREISTGGAVALAEDVACASATPALGLMIEETLESLPEEHRLILLMSQETGYTIAEIAALIGRSPGRVGAMLAEAKRMFRRKFKRAEEWRGQ